LITNTTVFAPGNISNGGGLISTPITPSSEPQGVYVAPPAPEPAQITDLQPEIEKILESRERGSIFQTLAQKTEALTASQSVPFIPFTGESKTKEEGKSKLRIIPNVADIEADTSTFTAVTPTQPIQEEKPKSRSSDLLVCEQCGTILSSDYAFCNKCGNKL
jgi:hypothetical protein